MYDQGRTKNINNDLERTVKSNMQSISVYLNKNASGSLKKSWKDFLNLQLFRSKLNYRSPQSINELSAYICEDLSQGVNIFISIGGDGTVNTMIQFLADQDVSLLLLPGGTANDLASSLCDTEKFHKMIESIRTENKKNIDLICVNGRYMATNGGIGLAADVAQKINGLRKKVPLFNNVLKSVGKKIYPIFLAREFLDLNIPKYKLDVKSREFSGDIVSSLVLINNQPVIGGSFPIAPKTNNSDGTFNVTIFTHKNRFALIQSITKVVLEKDLSDDPDIISFETQDVLLSSPQKITFIGDGEVFEPSRELRCKVQPGALSVYFYNSHLCENYDFTQEEEVAIL